MAIKHTPTGIVHKGYKDGKTGCGTDTKQQPTHWVPTTENVSCDKNGCKN